ncbi:MAG: carboxylating nicotinate-nucleotide diphosphorylase [Burkholderiales bacterium]
MDSDTTIENDVTAALAEDLGTGDLAAPLIAPEKQAQARVVSRESAVLCGSAWFEACFRRLDPNIKIDWHARDGERIEAGRTLCNLAGNARALLSAERCALNFLQILSATATRTRRYVEAVEGFAVQIMDTRKTVPGLRFAQKYAVRTGGGINQRSGLYDAALIKENHIAVAGGVANALRCAQAALAAGISVQIEVENTAQLQDALGAGAKRVLLDNFSLEALRQAVHLNAGRALLEASGGINLDNIRAIAQTGVDRISVGDLTKNITAVDFSMRVVTD